MKKKYTKPPRFSVVPENVANVVSVGDLRDLVFWVLSDQHGPPAPQWLNVQNRSAIKRMVSIMIPGLERPYAESELNNIKPRAFTMEELPVLSHFDHVWPTRAPGSAYRLDSTVAEFTRIPFTAAEKKQQEKERAGKSTEITYESLLMTPELLKECEYPLEVGPGWIELEPLDRPLRVYALDCEMVETNGSDRVLARVSVIDEQLGAVYETFVKPADPITNYLTPYSGITPQLLENVQTTLEDVQEWFKTNISKDDILIGHSLEFDLNVLKLVHRKVIDTAVSYQHPRGLPWKPSLKWLAKRYLGLDIQTGTEGHDSAQDAGTCMQLVGKKMKHGINYGCQAPSMGIVEKLSLCSLATAIVDYGTPRWDQGHAKTICSISSDAEAAKKAAGLTKAHDFVYVRFRELESAQGWYAETPAGLDMTKVYAELNENIRTVLDAVEPNTAVIIWSGQSDPREMNRLQQKKRRFQAEFATKKWDEIEDPWTDADNTALAAATLKARMGIAFLQVFKSEQPKLESEALKVESELDASAEIEPPTKKQKKN